MVVLSLSKVSSYNLLNSVLRPPAKVFATVVDLPFHLEGLVLAKQIGLFSFGFECVRTDIS